MKKIFSILAILVILNVIFTAFLFIEYLKTKPIIEDLREHYLIEIKK